MKILDRYLIKQFLQTLAFALLAFALLFVVIDMMEKLGDILDQNVPTNIIMQYYFVFIPEIIRLMTPVAILLASLFTAGKMANLNEMTAIKAGGISLYRFMTPFLVTTLLISIFSTFFGGYLVPMANKHRIFIEKNYMKKDAGYFGSNIFFQDSKTRIVTINYYDLDRATANQVTIQDFDPNDKTKLVGRIDALRMTYNTKHNDWQIYQGLQRRFTDTTEVAQKLPLLEIRDLNFKPTDVIKKQQKLDEMTLSDLNVFANDQFRTGNDPTPTMIEYHSRIAYAFASIVVVLFVLPISTNKRRGGLAIQLGINLLITFLYLVFMKISQAFGKSGALNPFLTAWMANFIFLLAAVYNIKRAEK
jgi:lipopolysaccharide export system permease protein